MKPGLLTLYVLTLVLALTAAPLRLQAAEPGCEEKGSVDYTVKKGDTLWDISSSHLNNPFCWPSIWKQNNFIQNPDLIYPGQKIRLPGMAGKEAGEGEAAPAPEMPQAAEPGGPFVEPGKTIMKKTEDMGRVIVEEAPKKDIPVYEEGAILAAGFIAESLDGEPEIKGSPLGKRLVFAMGDELYIDSRPGMKKGGRYVVLRPEHEVDHPATGKDLGELVRVTGVLRLEKEQEGFYLCRIDKSFSEIRDTDRLMPYTKPELIYGPAPRNDKLEGKWGYIVETMGSKKMGDILSTVYLDMGEDEGVRPGDVFIVRRSGSYEKQKPGEHYLVVKEYALPDVEVGAVQVMSVQKGTSTANVVEMKEAIEPGFRVYYRE